MNIYSKKQKELRINISKTLELALKKRISEEKQRIDSCSLKENPNEDFRENQKVDTYAGVAEFGQRRSVQGAVPQGFEGSNPSPRTTLFFSKFKEQLGRYEKFCRDLNFQVESNL